MSRDKLFKRVIGGIVILLIVMVIAREFMITDHKFHSEKVTELEEWYYNNEKVVPGDIEVGTEPYTLTTNEMPEIKTLLLRSSLSDLKVNVDGQLVYEYMHQSENGFKKPRASLWHIVDIPEGSEISITYHSPYKKMNGRINPVISGYESDLMLYVFHVYGWPFIIDCMILFLGVIMLLIAFVYPKSIYSNIFNIGLFAIIIAAWLISESRMLQYFTGSEWLIGSLAFISLPVIAVPFLFYFKSVVDQSKHKILNVLIIGCIINLILVVALQVLDIVDFFETVRITHSYIVAVMGCVFIMMSIELRYQNKNIWHLLVSLGILFAFIGLEMTRFYILDSANVTFFIRVGILIFISMMSINSGRQIFARIRKSYKAEFYEKLAYKDQLTGAPNRAAFERDFEEMFEHEDIKNNLTLFIMDLNNLKAINDAHGHVTGDTAIKEAYRLIHNHLRSIGKTYRIGGDEFASLVEATDFDIKLAEESLRKHIKVFSKSQAYDFGIAIGRVKYSDNMSIRTMMNHADLQMYDDKKILTKINEELSN